MVLSTLKKVISRADQNSLRQAADPWTDWFGKLPGPRLPSLAGCKEGLPAMRLF